MAVAEVNSKHEQLGADLHERLAKQQAFLELRQKARQDADALLQWLGPREQSLVQGQTASPSRPEVLRAQAQQNKVSTVYSIYIQYIFSVFRCLPQWLVLI